MMWTCNKHILKIIPFSMLSLLNLVSFTSAVDLGWDWHGHGGLPTGSPWIFSGVYFLHFTFQNKFKVLFSQTTDNRAVSSGSEDALCCSGLSAVGPLVWAGVSCRHYQPPLNRSPPGEITANKGVKMALLLSKLSAPLCTVNKEQAY